MKNEIKDKTKKIKLKGNFDAENHVIQIGIPATAGTGIIAAVVLLIGINLLIQFIQFDIQNQPRRE